MGSLGEKLRAAQTVGLDSAIFIYYFEGHSRYQELCADAFDLMEVGAIQAVTSIVTLIEVLVQPLVKGGVSHLIYVVVAGCVGERWTVQPRYFTA